MKYHASIKTDETNEIYEFDHNNLDDIKEAIVIPYLKNEEFQFNGYFIEPSKVKRLVITETELSSDQYVKAAHDRMASSGIFLPIGPEHCAFGDEHSKDITRRTLQEAKAMIEKSGTLNTEKRGKSLNQGNTKHKETIFLGYSYRHIDDEFVSGFKELLTDKGFDVIDGKADGLGSISQAIIEKISISDIVIIVMTKRDKKENGKFTTAAWLLEEKGAALALKKEVGMFVEEEIDENDIGGMQGDNQRFHFTRNSFLKVAMNFLKIIDKNRAG
jgi:hypothetical protein